MKEQFVSVPFSYASPASFVAYVVTVCMMKLAFVLKRGTNFVLF